MGRISRINNISRINRQSGGKAGPPPPVADFSVDDATIDTAATATFTDLSTNTPTSWLWEKNDGGGWVNFASTSANQNPTQQFTAGTWSIRLTATNAGGSDVETKTSYMTVTASGPTAFTITFNTAAGFKTLTALGNATIDVACIGGGSHDGDGVNDGGGGGEFVKGVEVSILSGDVYLAFVGGDASHTYLYDQKTLGTAVRVQAMTAYYGVGGTGGYTNGFKSTISKAGGDGGAAGAGGGGGGGESGSLSAVGNKGSNGGASNGGAGGTGGSGGDGGAGGNALQNGNNGISPGGGGGGAGIGGVSRGGGADGLIQITGVSLADPPFTIA